MFIIGIFVHCLFLFSIFDIYFKSPVVRGVPPYQPQHESLADRLVLFVVDGLRAESFLNQTTMSYLRSVANTHGRWGISHTRVPTESRPGHVAVIAGFYEDPSAIAKGWKENPVDFDSVFNQTVFTWCWGTYDIVEIFTKGNIDDHIYAETFDPYDQSFSSDKNTTLLDHWVFDKVNKFFYQARHNITIHNKLQKKKIAFFLHLLGTDTSGHTHKPGTRNFLETLRFVDKGIKEIEHVIRDFYNDDGKTTFLMTSDHGMTNWGSHGSGDLHETETPFVIWGAGVNQTRRHKDDDDEFDDTRSWSQTPKTYMMSHNHRIDVQQADLTPLMATILSIPVPVNSIGEVNTEILNMSSADRSKAIYSNARQLAAQYNKKRSDVEAHVLRPIYYPFMDLTEEAYEEMIHFTEDLLNRQQYENLIAFSKEMMRLSLTGLNYYHNYYQKPLLILVTLSFIGWIACLLKELSEQSINTQAETDNMKKFILSKRNSRNKLVVNVLFFICLFISCYLVYAQNLPVQYYLYFTLPIFMWWHVLSSMSVWRHMFRQLQISRGFCTLWMEVIFYTLGCFALGLSFTHRWMLSVPLTGMGLWPFVTSSDAKIPKSIRRFWLVSCLFLSYCSFKPVVGKEVFIEKVIAAGLLELALSAMYMRNYLLPLYREGKEHKREIIWTVIQMVFMAVSLQNVYVQSKRFENGTSVSHVDQAVAWIIAVSSLMFPLLHSKRVYCRLQAINTSLLNFYLLLSVSHEGLFMVALSRTVFIWVYIEFKLLQLPNVRLIDCTFQGDNFEQKSKNLLDVERGLSSHDFRRAFFFIVFIIVAFFGTGNIASLNSFEVRWVTCFITSFQPFVITGLILLKTLTPFLVVACGFRTIQFLTKAPSGYLNMIVLIYSNIMGIQLLFNVKNVGSWLEIGTSISQFVIVQVITLFIVLISQLAKILADASIYNLAQEVNKSRKKFI